MRRVLFILLKVRAHLFRLVAFKRARVRLDTLYAQLRKETDNRARLNFQLACQIVDTNLTHPPLFKTSCRQYA
jgi:hypothetical protein